MVKLRDEYFSETSRLEVANFFIRYLEEKQTRIIQV